METPWLDRTAYPFSHHTLEVVCLSFNVTLRSG